MFLPKNKEIMKNTLVMGASLKPTRYSHIIIHRLREQGVPVIAYGLRRGRVADVEIQTDFENVSDVHTVTLYLNPARQQPFYDTIIGLKPERVIFNPGTENPEFYSLLEREGIEVEVACNLVMLATNQF